MTPRRLGVFGGSFDPVHLGHLAVAEDVRVRRGLDKVIFVPAARSPHKAISIPADAADRLEMLRLAVASNPAFAVDDLEVVRGGMSYTIETLQTLKRGWGDGVDLELILGADAAAGLDSWKDAEGILRLCRVVVVTRPGWETPSGLAGLSPSIRAGVVVEPCVLLDISSTMIRERVHKGESLRYLVPEGVGEYIHSHGLYR